MPDIEDSKDLFEEGLPDIDPTDVDGQQASAAEDKVDAEIDDLSEKHGDDVGHGLDK